MVSKESFTVLMLPIETNIANQTENNIAFKGFL